LKADELLNIIGQIRKNVDLIRSDLNSIDFSKFDEFSAELDRLISVKQAEQQQISYYYSKSMNPVNMSAKSYRNFYQQVYMSEKEIQSLSSRFMSLISFEFPVLELFPGNGKFTVNAVAGEPLYIADYYMENLDEVGKLFNDFFNANRLFKYEIKDFELTNMPNDQFGLIFCYNYFIVKDIDFIINWAVEVLRKLRPGGQFIFNFIPYDTVDGVRLFEDKQMPVINYNLLEQKLVEMGYEFVKKTIDYGFCSTMLVKKPGELNQFKLTGSIAAIIDKS